MGLSLLSLQSRRRYGLALFVVSSYLLALGVPMRLQTLGFLHDDRRNRHPTPPTT
jgi:hypothetical protein